MAGNGKDKTVLMFSVLMGVCFFVLILIIIGFVRNVRSASEETYIEDIELIDDIQIYQTKLEAYQDEFQDSLSSVRSENVHINLHSLFSSTQEKAISDEMKEVNKLTEEVINETQEPEPAAQPTQTKIVYVTKPAPQKESEPQPVSQPLPRKTGFLSSSNSTTNSKTSSFIQAVIHQNTTVENATAVKFRFTKEFVLNGHIIPEGKFVTGVASLRNQRVVVRFQNLSINGQLLPFKYTIYDPDGIEGVLVPDLVINETTKNANSALLQQASSRITVPLVGSVAINTAQRQNNKVTATLVKDYPVTFKPY